MTKVVLTLSDGGECMAQVMIGGKLAGVAYGHSGLEGQGVFLDKVQMQNEASVKVGEILVDFGIALQDAESTLGGNRLVTSRTSGGDPSESFF